MGDPSMTRDELLAELDAAIQAQTYPPREAGDIDANDIIQRYGYEKDKADRTLTMLGKRPGWVRLKVFDADSQRIKWVIRKEA